MCVQDVDVQCVLQFTLLHAAGCALHRHTSRVIHRLELYLEFAIFRSPTSAYNYVHALSVTDRTLKETRRKTARRGDEQEATRSSNRRKRSAHTEAMCRTPLSPETTTTLTVQCARPAPRPTENAAAAIVQSGTGTPKRTQLGKIFPRYPIGFSGQPRPPLSVHTCVVSCRPTDRRSSTISVMILPQVHLRKPCYDFYFL